MFCDGFDNSSQAEYRWNGVSIANRLSYSTGSARFGTGQGCVLTDNVQVTKQSSGTFTTVRIQVGIRTGDTNYTGAFLYLLDADASAQVALNRITGGRIKAFRSTGIELGTTDNAVFTESTYHYMQLESVIHATTGTILLKWNGITVLNLTGINTKASALTGAPGFRFINGDGHTLWLDDLIQSSNDDAAPFNALLPDQRVIGLPPNAVGNASDFTRTGGSASGNYTAVSETDPDEDTSYVASSTVNQKDTYGVTNLPASVTSINAVAVNIRARKDDAADRKIAAVVRSSTTESTGADIGLPATYGNSQTIFLTDPNTSAAWTPAGVDSMEVGQKVTA